MTSTDDKIMCAVIKVDVPNNCYLDRSYIIPYKPCEQFNKNAQEFMEYIKIISSICNVPVKRIYISGFLLASQSDLWDEKKLANHYRNHFCETVSSKKR